MRTALAAVALTCRPSGLLPFSLSQNLIVPFLGIREGPLHTALQDTYDEAVTITSILRGAVNRHFTATAQPKKKHQTAAYLRHVPVVPGVAPSSLLGGS